MRRVFLGLVFIALFWSPLAFPKDKDKEMTERLPLFMDPEFQFSQVQTICLAPTLDLRTDKSLPLFSIDTADRFKDMGHQTAKCDPVGGTLSLSDLTAPSGAILQKLDFGQSSWLFILAVEAVEDAHKTTHTWSDVFTVVSGFLFEKNVDTVRLVWWNRAIGSSGDVNFPGLFWESNQKVREANRSTDIGRSVGIGVNRLLAPFEPPSKKHPALYFAVHEDNFGESCDAVWTALKDALGHDPKKYNAALLDDANRMALYRVGHKKLPGILYDEDDVVLKAQQGGCEMQIQLTTSLHFGHHPTILDDNWKDLIKHMRASLSK